MEAELLNQHSVFLLCSTEWGTAMPPWAPREQHQHSHAPCAPPLGSDTRSHRLLSLLQKCRCWQGAEVTTNGFTFSEMALRHRDYSGSSRQELTGWFCLVSTLYLHTLG